MIESIGDWAFVVIFGLILLTSIGHLIQSSKQSKRLARQTRMMEEWLEHIKEQEHK